MDWFEMASLEVADFRAETATHEARKKFYGDGGGVKRASRMLAQLDALRVEVQQFIRA